MDARYQQQVAGTDLAYPQRGYDLFIRLSGVLNRFMMRNVSYSTFTIGKNKYSRLSLSRLRLSRITAYLEEKI